MRHQMQSLLEEKSIQGDKSVKRELICERQGKSIYQSDKPDFAIQVLNSNGITEEGKHIPTNVVDALRNKISSYLFEYIEGFHIPTHFISKLSDVEMMVKRTEIIPLTVKVFNSVSGTLMKRFNVKEIIQTDFPIIEHYFNNGTRTNAWVNEYHVYALGFATPEEFKQINRIASKTNAVLRGLCDRRNLSVVDLHLEFGRYKNQVILIDEISPLNCHFLDVSNGNRAKRDKYSIDHENAEEALTELADRLMSKI